MNEHHGPGEVLPALLGQVAAGGDAQLGRKRLDEHGHQVADDDHPQQGVAELGAAGDIGGEIAGVDVSYAGDEGRSHEGQQARKATFFTPPAQHFFGGIYGNTIAADLLAFCMGFAWRLAQGNSIRTEVCLNYITILWQFVNFWRLVVLIFK